MRRSLFSMILPTLAFGLLWLVNPATGSAAEGEKPSAPEVSAVEPLPAAPRPTAPRAPADVAEAPADALKTDSGLAWKILRKGAGGPHPGPHDKVTVHYTGWTAAGKTFDSSIPRGAPSTFLLDDVIRGWTEGVQLMTKGEKRRFWIPAALAYGDAPSRRDEPTGPLVFNIELVDFVRMPDPVVVPDDVAAAPDDAQKTRSGLAYKILRHGSGKAHPTSTDTVEVHYSGWTPDGKLFDSSVVRGKPTSFPLDGVIKGWTEGVQLMVVGDKARFWIPGRLAYGDKPARPGTPAGPLVFDVELLSIK
ncbi:MAG TPA: FKBP-type peptidyl-prolyl cis-trans isomerase [Polyangia bacterium]|jgi:peptidylprolyl isomerase|nr:FKBP-type peptidyl-prolyl cis-trans isomerase [Polyangia bacterium]